MDIEKDIEIKFLVQGTVLVEKPLSWESFTLEEKRRFADIVMENTPEETLIDGMRTTDVRSYKLWEDPINAQAIRDESNEVLEYEVASPMWLMWTYGEDEEQHMLAISPREEDYDEDTDIILDISLWVVKIWKSMIRFIKGIFTKK